MHFLLPNVFRPCSNPYICGSRPQTDTTVGIYALSNSFACGCCPAKIFPMSGYICGRLCNHFKRVIKRKSTHHLFIFLVLFCGIVDVLVSQDFAQSLSEEVGYFFEVFLLFFLTDSSL
jgi:hypothetical protein